MSATSTSFAEFEKSCYADYVLIGARKGVEWLRADAAECAAAAEYYQNPPWGVEVDIAAARRAGTRARIANEIADTGAEAIRREARGIHRRGRGGGG